MRLEYKKRFDGNLEKFSNTFKNKGITCGMKKELKTNPFEIVKQPFFRKGILRFASSGHYLRVSGKNYRCDLKCRGKCDKKELQPNKEDMDRKFSRYAVNFEFEDNKNNEQFIIGLIKDVLHKMIDGEDWGAVIRQGYRLEDTVETIKAELKSSGAVLKEDLQDFQNQFAGLNTVNPQLLLTCMVLGIFKNFSEPENEADMGKALSLLCKRIYITDKGKIKEILLEDWGWYIMHFINRHVPNYIQGLEKKGVKILNKSTDKILSLDIKEAVSYFNEDNFEDALHSNSIKYFYELFSIFKTLVDPIVQGKFGSEQKQGLVKGLELMNTPIFTSLFKVMQIGDIKLRRKIEKRREKSDIE